MSVVSSRQNRHQEATNQCSPWNKTEERVICTAEWNIAIYKSRNIYVSKIHNSMNGAVQQLARKIRHRTEEQKGIKSSVTSLYFMLLLVL